MTANRIIQTQYSLADQGIERRSEQAERSQNEKRAQDFKATAPAREGRACARRCLSGEDARNGECLKAAALPETNDDNSKKLIDIMT